MKSSSRARIDYRSRRITLPVPDAERVTFSVAGTWGDNEYGPDATLIEVKFCSRRRHGSYRLSRDASFELPEGITDVQITVLQAIPSTRLEVSLSPYVAPALKPEKAERCRLGPWAWDEAAREGGYGLQRARRQRKA
jgi:hypothetical protein